MSAHFSVRYSLYYPLSPPPPSSHWYQPSALGRTFPALSFSDFAEEKRERIKRKKENMTFLLVQDKVSYTGEFPYDIFMHICIVPAIGLFPLIIYFLP
jgi:hypothetical protein